MKRNSKSSLFLIELIIVILFFSIAGAVCIQLFVKSYLLGKETEGLNVCVKHSQNFAEVFNGMGGDTEEFTAFFEDSLITISDDSYSVYITEDDTFTTDMSQAAYRGDLLFSTENSIVTLNISFYQIKNNEEIYSISVDKYLGRGGAQNE
ncbi:MAG: hypothetical protein IJX86_06310 [Lachnospiraceae bacterium]|nr:hypothetical protein [Lachnospiraceae bacterium]